MGTSKFYRQQISESEAYGYAKTADPNGQFKAMDLLGLVVQAKRQGLSVINVFFGNDHPSDKPTTIILASNSLGETLAIPTDVDHLADAHRVEYLVLDTDEERVGKQRSRAIARNLALKCGDRLWGAKIGIEDLLALIYEAELQDLEREDMVHVYFGEYDAKQPIPNTIVMSAKKMELKREIRSESIDPYQVEFLEHTNDYPPKR